MTLLATLSRINATHTEGSPTAISAMNVNSFFEDEEIQNVAEALVPKHIAANFRVKAIATSADPSTGVTVNKYTMTRKRLRTSKLANRLVDSTVDAFNEGRILNDTRYDDELRNIDSGLDAAQNMLSSLFTQFNAHYNMLAPYIAGFGDSYDEWKTDNDGLLDGWGDAERQRINTAFDNKLAESRQEAMRRGIYNSTTWFSISATIEKERQNALTQLEDSIIARKLAQNDSGYSKRLEAKKLFVDAQNGLLAMYDNMLRFAIETQNRYVMAYAQAVEARTDSYPQLSEVNNAISTMLINPDVAG